MSGLSANQAGLSIVSSNVANASTPGYVSQNLNLVEQVTGGIGTGVQVAGITRALDTYVQSQLRTETSGEGYADQTSSVLQQLQNVYGTPGGQGTLETAFTNLTTAVQGLSANSGAYSAQSSVVTAAQNMAQALNSTTQGIQALRTNVQQDIGTSVSTANSDLTQIANLNSQLQGLSQSDPSAATLEDQRDTAINQLSQLMDVRVTTSGNNQVTIYTNSGVQLVGTQASTLSFNGPATLNASNLFSTNPTQNGVGTITLTSPSGATVDMDKAFSSGQIAADLQLRDTTLVQAQTQVDQLAASMSSALSDTTTAGTAVTRPPAGFTLDLSNLQPGNTINLTYTNTATNTQQQLQIVAVGSSSVLPLPTTSSTSPGTTVIGVDVSSGCASIASQLTAVLGTASLQFYLVRLDLTGARRHRHRGCRERGLGDHHGLVAHQRQRGAATVYRWRLSLYGSYHPGRVAADGLCRTHHREPRGGRQPVQSHGLQHIASDRVRRYHARGLHQFATDFRFVHLRAADRSWLVLDAVHRHDHKLHAAVPQSAGQQRDQCAAIGARPGRRREHAAGELQFRHRRQHGHANVQSDFAAECLFGQRPCDGRGAIDVHGFASVGVRIRPHGDQ